LIFKPVYPSLLIVLKFGMKSTFPLAWPCARNVLG
jgi:hypothetical protein